MIKLKIIGVIPARYQSSRFPGKPLVPILGKTLLQHCYENAQRCSFLDHLAIATDDERIFQHARSLGAHAIMTSPHCATGTDRLVEALGKDPLLQQAELLVNIQGDEPCVSPDTIEKVLQALLSNSHAPVATPITPLKTEQEAQSPSIVKCVVNLKGEALYFSRTLIPSNKKRLFLPSHTYWRHIGLYAFRASFLPLYTSLPPSPLQLIEDLEQLKILENGYSIQTIVVEESSFGVDIPEDIEKIKELLCKKNISLSQAESALR